MSPISHNSHIFTSNKTLLLFSYNKINLVFPIPNPFLTLSHIPFISYKNIIYPNNTLYVLLNILLIISRHHSISPNIMSNALSHSISLIFIHMISFIPYLYVLSLFNTLSYYYNNIITLSPI